VEVRIRVVERWCLLVPAFPSPPVGPAGWIGPLSTPEAMRQVEVALGREGAGRDGQVESLINAIDGAGPRSRTPGELLAAVERCLRDGRLIAWREPDAFDRRRLAAETAARAKTADRSADAVRTVGGGGAAGTEAVMATAASAAKPLPTAASASAATVGSAWIEVLLIGDDDRPIAREHWRARPADGAWGSGRVGDDGLLRLTGIADGECAVSFDDLDAASWQSRGAAVSGSTQSPAAAALRHRVVQGDSVASVAQTHGFAPDTIWDHPDNAALRQQREHANILAPGDVVVIPAREAKTVLLAVGRRHVFHRRGVPAVLRLQFYDEARQQRVGVAWRLRVAGVPPASGQTDEQGVLCAYLPADARSGELALGPPSDDEERYQLAFGHLDPVATPAGVTVRLASLGFIADPDAVTAAVRSQALRAFQRRCQLPVTGEADDATRAKLVAVNDGLCAYPPPPKPPAT